MRCMVLGRLIALKRVDLAIRAFALVKHASSGSFELHIVGGGPEQTSLEALTQDLGVAEQVTFWGALPRREALSLLWAFDLLLHPSESEGAPWAVAEALGTEGSAS